ncbi:glycosyltransferase [candidate division WWE3 bacterium]|nr:glycosyltransferase [candidate division WWE3 bacterium]
MNLRTAQSDFNQEENVIVVTSYPEVVGKSLSNISGVATYSFHMLPSFTALLNKSDRNLIIIADKIGGKNSHRLENENSLLLRVWQRKSLGVFREILNAIGKFTKVKKILFHFEFNMFADAYVTGLLPWYLFILKLRGKEVTILMHQVVEDLSNLSGHLNIKRGSLRMLTLSFLLNTYTKLLCLSSSKIIVHDEVLKQRLKKIVKKEVFVVPHGLGEYTHVADQNTSREHLEIKKSKFVVLCFGFLTWYKGSDWIVDEFINYFKRTKDTSVQLILAGGKSATLSGHSNYDAYYDSLVNKVLAYPTIKITGYIPESEVKYYYGASDIVVLPYRFQMSASGPFSIGLSMERPFLLSENLKGVLYTEDIKYAMEEFNLNERDLLFKLEDRSFFAKIIKLINNKREITTLKKLSTQISKERQWKKVVNKFLYILDA